MKHINITLDGVLSHTRRIQIYDVGCDTAIMPIVGYVVMPPAHGKSWISSRLPGLREADGIFDCKGNQRLRLLRSQAKVTNSWLAYNTAWAEELIARAPPLPVVVMVPSFQLGELMTNINLGGYALEFEVWCNNLDNRGASFLKYLECYNDCVSNTSTCIFPSNEILQGNVIRRVELFLTQL